MTDIMITDLPTASSIDAVVDTFPIVNSALNETQQISRNTFLGITSQPVGISEPQTLTEKTLDNTNIITLKDTLFTLQDDGDVTRQAKFQLSGITAGQIRTYTLPDASSTLMDIATAQTASNKTLVTPTVTSGINITSGTLAVTQNATVGGTLAVIGISTFTSNPVFPAGSTNSVIKNANLNTTAGDIGGSWTSWDPTLSGRLNDAKWTKNCKWSQIGKTVNFKVYIKASTTTPMDGVSGEAVFSLPTTAVPVAGDIPIIGGASFLDAGTARYTGFVEYNSTTTARVRYTDTNAVTGGDTMVSSTAPFTWTTNDEISCQGTYEMA